MEKRITFKNWYEENCSSEILREEYDEYKFECKEQMGIPYLTFRQWMKEQYNELIEYQEL